ncbi:MAG: thiamine phosphate synthase [Acidiferrobacterales bacterium]
MATSSAVTGVYAIADTGCIAPDHFTESVQKAIAGGAAIVQYRDKHFSQGAETRALELSRLCQAHRVPLIINDDPYLAARLGAAGVHLGRDDPGLEQARKLLGPQAIIGVSCYNELDRALAAEADGADYVAFGSFYPSPTKPTAVRATLELLRAARGQLRLPMVAIGGITPENGAALIAAGADVLAVIHGVFAQPDIERATRRYVALFARADEQDEQ